MHGCVTQLSKVRTVDDVADDWSLVQIMLFSHFAKHLQCCWQQCITQHVCAVERTSAHKRCCWPALHQQLQLFCLLHLAALEALHSPCLASLLLPLTDQAAAAQGQALMDQTGTHLPPHQVCIAPNGFMEYQGLLSL